MYNLCHIVSCSFRLTFANFNANIPNNAYIEYFDKRKTQITNKKRVKSTIRLHSYIHLRPFKHHPKAEKKTPQSPLKTAQKRP
nr:MAG TPA: hypothetical protein [Caudoviricetes sp.]